MRIGEPRALERRGSIRVLPEIDQRIAVGKPRAVMVGRALEYPPYFLARPRRVPGAAVSAREIDARLGKLRRRSERPCERLKGCGGLAPREERSAWPVMGEGRADIVAAGALIIDELFNRFPSEALVCSTQGLRYGLARMAADEVRSRERQGEPSGDGRRP